MQIEQKLSENKQIIIIKLIGGFDIEDSSYFENSVNTIIESEGKKLILFNLESLDYLNSSALNNFILIYNKLRKKGIKIELCNATKPVETLFNITSLNLIIKIHNSEWDAIQSLTKN